MSPTSIQKLVYTLLGGGYSIIYVFETNTALQVYYVCSSLIEENGVHEERQCVSTTRVP
jgi:hypothetical protein